MILQEELIMTNEEWLANNGIPSNYHLLTFILNTISNNTCMLDEYEVVQIELDGRPIDYMNISEFKDGQVLRGQWLSKECEAKVRPIEQAFLIDLWKMTAFRYIYSVRIKTDGDDILLLRIGMISGEEFSLDTRYLNRDILRFDGLGDEQYHWTPEELGIAKRI